MTNTISLETLASLLVFVCFFFEMFCSKNKSLGVEKVSVIWIHKNNSSQTVAVNNTPLLASNSCYLELGRHNKEKVCQYITEENIIDMSHIFQTQPVPPLDLSIFHVDRNKWGKCEI